MKYIPHKWLYTWIGKLDRFRANRSLQNPDLLRVLEIGLRGEPLRICEQAILSKPKNYPGKGRLHEFAFIRGTVCARKYACLSQT